MYEINKTVVNIVCEALRFYRDEINLELQNAEDDIQESIFDSQVKTASVIIGMFCDLKPGETIKLVDGGTDATIQPYIKKVDEAHD